MNFPDQLQPPALWREFAAVCAVPHPSGHESALREMLCRRAGAAGLRARVDAAGNLRIDRTTAEDDSRRPILLQGHLDMVPQCDRNVVFDFLTQGVRPRIDGAVVRADRTTLGADDGIGIAAGMALLLDPAFADLPLALLGTVEEETGLTGASRIDPEFLQGAALLNLDSEEEGELYIGCAGGTHRRFALPLRREASDPAETGVRLRVSGMKGGHSGMEIDAGRGNALRLLLELLDGAPEFRIAALDGGSLDNAIPREAEAVGTISAAGLAALTERAADAEQEARRRFDVAAGFAIRVDAVPRPDAVLEAAPARRLTAALLELPHGVMRRDETLKMPAVSNNFAAVHTVGDELQAVTLTRAFRLDEQQALADRIAAVLAPLGGRIVVDNSYSGWDPKPDSRLAETARRTYRRLFGTLPELKVIHAGLECGLFAAAAPELEMISFGPTIRHPHSPAEEVEIASVGRFYRYLGALVRDLAG